MAFFGYPCSLGVTMLGGYVSFHRFGQAWLRWTAFVVFVLLGSGGAYATYQIQKKSDTDLLRLQNGIDTIALKVGVEKRGLGAYLQYAYEWNNYLGATNTPDPRTWYRPIVSTVALRRTPNVSPDNRLDLGVYNTGTPVEDVRLTVVLPDGLVMKRGGCWSRPWRSLVMRGEIDRTFYCEFGTIDTDQGYHADYPMMLDTSGGTYRFRYEITAKNTESIESNFTAVIAARP